MFGTYQPCCQIFYKIIPSPSLDASQQAEARKCKENPEEHRIDRVGCSEKSKTTEGERRVSAM